MNEVAPQIKRVLMKEKSECRRVAGRPTQEDSWNQRNRKAGKVWPHLRANKNFYNRRDTPVSRHFLVLTKGGF